MFRQGHTQPFFESGCVIRGPTKFSQWRSGFPTRSSTAEDTKPGVVSSGSETWSFAGDVNGLSLRTRFSGEYFIFKRQEITRGWRNFVEKDSKVLMPVRNYISRN